MLPHGYKIFNGPSSLPSSMLRSKIDSVSRVRSIINQYIQGNSRALSPCSKSYEYFLGPVAIAMHLIAHPRIKNNVHVHEMLRGTCTDGFYVSPVSINVMVTDTAAKCKQSFRVEVTRVLCTVTISNFCKLANFHGLHFRCICRWSRNPWNLHTAEISTRTVIHSQCCLTWTWKLG